MPREDDASVIPPHGDTLDRATARDEARASRHGVQLDPRGEPTDAARDSDDTAPSTPRTDPAPNETP